MIYFLKLGGSLITYKNRKSIYRKTILNQIVSEIADAFSNNKFALLVGHGSGSFGHVPANIYHTRQGVKTAEDWKGFTKVWKEARILNQIVVSAFQNAGLPIMAFPPSASMITNNGKIIDWDVTPIKSALSHNIIPLIQGDVVFDLALGGTIVSTEEIFHFLAQSIKPNRIFLAGIEEGVWKDFPVRSTLLKTVSPEIIQDCLPNLSGSVDIDVTGGMQEKVKNMLELVKDDPDLKINIFSGATKNRIFSALSGQDPGGTEITSKMAPNPHGARGIL